MDKTLHCIRCNKKLEFLFEDTNQIDGGGNVEITCWYGSRFDMGLDLDQGKPIQAYICDDCIDILYDQPAVSMEVKND